MLSCCLVSSQIAPLLLPSFSSSRFPDTSHQRSRRPDQEVKRDQWPLDSYSSRVSELVHFPKPGFISKASILVWRRRREGERFFRIDEPLSRSSFKGKIGLWKVIPFLSSLYDCWHRHQKCIYSNRNSFLTAVIICCATTTILNCNVPIEWYFWQYIIFL